MAASIKHYVSPSTNLELFILIIGTLIFLASQQCCQCLKEKKNLEKEFEIKRQEQAIYDSLRPEYYYYYNNLIPATTKEIAEKRAEIRKLIDEIAEEKQKGNFNEVKYLELKKKEKEFKDVLAARAAEIEFNNKQVEKNKEKISLKESELTSAKKLNEEKKKEHGGLKSNCR